MRRARWAGLLLGLLLLAEPAAAIDASAAIKAAIADYKKKKGLE